MRFQTAAFNAITLVAPFLLCFGYSVNAEVSPNTTSTPVSTSTSAVIPAALEQFAFDHVENDMVFFSAPAGMAAPKPLKTGLFELSYIGFLKSQDGGAPYFLFSGKPCRDCLDDRTVYAIRPDGTKPTSFVYPGEIRDPRSRALLLESRAFFGKCLPHRGDIFVIFQKEKIDRRRYLQPSVLIAEAGKDYFDENLIERHLPQISTTLKLVKRKSCHEIQGRNRLMLSKPLDLHPHSDFNNDEEDDDGDSTGSDPDSPTE